MVTPLELQQPPGPDDDDRRAEVFANEAGRLLVVRGLDSTWRPKFPKAITLASVRAHLQELRVSGYFFWMVTLHTRAVGKAHMAEELDWLEAQAATLKAAEVFAAAAGLQHNYARWYGDKDQDANTAIYRRAVAHLETAIALDPGAPEYPRHLASILVGTPQVRDLERARALMENPVLAAQMPRGFADLLSSINYREGIYRLDPEFSYERVCAGTSYTNFAELPSCRALIRKLKKSKDIETMRPVLAHQYRLAVIDQVLRSFAFHEEEEVLWVRLELERAVPAIRQMTFASHGHIKDALSRIDYLAFELVYGPNPAVFDPLTLLPL